MGHPILDSEPRRHQQGGFSATEVALANRNSGIHLEMLRHDVTPAGMHYLLSHFDIPFVTDAAAWRIEVGGLVRSPVSIGLADLKQLPFIREGVMMECAGNGRTLVSPRWLSQPWCVEALGNAEWGGCRLADLLDTMSFESSATELVFSGADQGVDGGVVHFFERSLTMDQVGSLDAIVAWEMNGQPLLPQHGFPVRLIVPGWFGMASVKWLSHITAIDHPFDGYQQVRTYRYRTTAEDTGIPITSMKVKSVLIPPGIPDWVTRKRLINVGEHEIMGRAWSGAGTPIEKVELGIDGQWIDAILDKPASRYAWQGWRARCRITSGQHELSCRATDVLGESQPISPVWDQTGMGNNVVHKVEVWGEDLL